MSLEAAIYNEARKAASGAPLWVSGMTVAKWQEVRSPLDGEVYRRKTATGGGTTDPAADLTNYVAVSYQRPTAITNAWSGGGAAMSGGRAYQPGYTNAMVSSPALSAGVRQVVLSVSGKGTLQVAGVHIPPAGGTEVTVRLNVIVDGRPIFDATNNFPGSSTSSYFVFAAGWPVLDPTNAVCVITPSAFEFARTLEVAVTANAARPANAVYNNYAYTLRG